MEQISQCCGLENEVFLNILCKKIVKEKMLLKFILPIELFLLLAVWVFVSIGVTLLSSR